MDKSKLDSILAAHELWRSRLPVTITLTRVAPRKLDSDNLERSMEAIRDGIADAFGVDDGDDRIEWRYDQRTGRAGKHSVDVEIRERGGE